MTKENQEICECGHEIEKLTKEESEKDIKNLRKDLSILFEQEDKTMKNARKLPYSEHWMKHWRKKIAEQYLFFYQLGLNSTNQNKLGGGGVPS